MIKALGFSQDANENGVPDVIEFTKLGQDANQHNDKMNLERDKLRVSEKIATEKNKIDKIKANKSGPSK